jgi:outer membrane protein OmpA-like peptidoglycan-associated protein
MMRNRTFALPFLLVAALTCAAPARAADHDHGAAPAQDAHAAPAAHTAPAKAKKPAKKKAPAHGAPEAEAHDAPKAAAHGASSSHETRPDADGTFTIQLDDPDADVPAGAPRGDLRDGKRAPHGTTDGHDGPAETPRAAPAHGKAAAHEEAPAPAHGKAAAHEEAAAPAHGKAAAHEEAAAPAHGKAAAHEEAPAPAHGKAAAHEEAPAPAHGKAAAHETDADADPENDETHELLDEAPKPKPKPKPKPRDWKPLTGTGFAEARRNKWGMVEAVPPAIAARTRMAFRGDEVEFPEKVHFKYNSITFERGADEVVAKIADALQSSPEIQKLWIEGHTDLSGGEAYNQKLSEARASAVREALVRRGVAPERLVAYGFGESRPAAAERRGKGVPANRRVLFRLVQADRPALQTRRVVEFGQAAVIGVWGAVRYRVSPLGAAARSPSTLPAGAVASNDAPDPKSHGAAPTATDARGGNAEADAEANAVAASMEDEDGWRALPFRTQLPEGAVIETGAGGMTLLRLPDLTRILVQGDTRLALTKLFHNHTEGKSYTSARLETGSLRVSANPDERGVSSSIWSFPGGAIELTTADFEVNARADGTSLAVLRGSAKASNGGAESIPIRAGERLPPGATSPQRLLAGPEIESPVNGTVADVTLIWKAVPRCPPLPGRGRRGPGLLPAETRRRDGRDPPGPRRSRPGAPLVLAGPRDQ